MNRHYFNQINRKKINGPAAAVLRYEGESGLEPAVLASGKGAAARKILETAKANDMVIQKDPTLIANLLDIELVEGVPPQLYAVMAEIFILLAKVDEKY
nr:EscU/YscU/HrcU family type III secretion system export apparatus switch protein [uncultured Bacillus sp.]